MRARMDLPADFRRPLGGNIAFRWENVPKELDAPLAFADARLKIGGAGGDGAAPEGLFRGRAAVLHPPTNLALFAVADVARPAAVGVKYNTQSTSVGVCENKLSGEGAVPRHQHRAGGEGHHG